MKSYTVNECEFCGFKSTDEKEVFQHEAAHLGLTVGEYETYWALKHKVKYFANPANVENTEIRTKIYNQAFTKLANFEKEHNITGNTQNENNHCPYACDRRDCDGDWDTYCTKDGHCQYQRNARDCDGDIISFCRM